MTFLRITAFNMSFFSLQNMLLVFASLHFALVWSQSTTATFAKSVRSSSVRATPSSYTSAAPTPSSSAVSFGGSQSSNYTVIDIWVQPARDRSNGALCNVTQTPYKRTVAYTVTSDGYAVIDGDVIFGTEADILNAAIHPIYRKRAISMKPTSSLKWPGGIILYNYEPGLEQLYIDFFQSGVKVWTDRLPFLKFVYSNSASARTVRKSDAFNSPVGCCGPQGPINLAHPSLNPSAAIHEIGHTLGLEHEHQRPDRNSYVTITCPNDLPNPCPPDVLFNVAPVDPAGYDWSGSYDINSVMHYGGSGYLGDTLIIIAAQPGFTLNIQTSVLQLPSRLDVHRLCELYWEDCHSICGDGILTPGIEECDDNNNLDDDGCSSSCKIVQETCVPSCKNLPPNNVCGFRSDCTLFNPSTSFPHSGETFCMCQAGYRGSGLDLSGKNQYRTTWQNGAGGQTHRVFVKPGQDCGQLCNGNDCSEVPLKDACR